MKIHAYTVRLIDPLFYAREALSGAFTPPYLHATALNHAVAWALGRSRKDQSYVIGDHNGGRNIPRYAHSFIEPDFYFTPASLSGDLDYYPETVKGDMDYYVSPGFGAAKINGVAVGKNEVLKSYRIFSLPPETELSGFLHVEDEILEKMPSYIRLGSFRGKAFLHIGRALHTKGTFGNQYVDHPVDPLVSKVRRGVMVPIFPYPLIDNALVSEAIEVNKSGNSVFVAVPVRKYAYDKQVVLARLEEIKPGLDKARDPNVPVKDRAYLLLHILRTVHSVRLFIRGVSGEERLDQELAKEEQYEALRKASKGAGMIENQVVLGLCEKIRSMIHDTEEKIAGKEKSVSPEGSGKGPSGLIL